MNAIVICFAVFLAAANAHSAAHILQGPSSRTTLVGPEGSVISAVAPGGQVVHEEHPGYVAHAASVVAPVVGHGYAAPVVAHGYSAPVVAHGYAGPVLSHGHAGVPVVSHVAPLAHSVVAPVVAHRAYGVHHGHVDSAVVAGPSGTIVTGKSALHVPLVAGNVLSHAAHVVPSAYAAHVGHHHEGQYVHDHSEALYDDGSYKPHLY